MQKKTTFITLLVVLAIIATFFIGRVQSFSAFPDVPPFSYFASAVEDMALRGIINGYDDGRFGPNDSINRAQVAVILQRYDDRVVAPLQKSIRELQDVLGIESDLSTTDITDYMCNDQYSLGESFEKDDGCTICSCTEEGIICDNELCTRCEPIVCPDNTIYPTCTEAGITIDYHGSPCAIASHNTDMPVCGNGLCEQKENDLPPNRRYHCPMDCTGEPVTRYCALKKLELEDLMDDYKDCQSNTDCRKISQPCPFITCAEAIHRRGVPDVEIALKNVLDTCRREGATMSCVLCSPSTAVCENGQCIMKSVQNE